MTPNPHLWFGVFGFAAGAGWCSWGASGGLVVAGGVEFEFAEQFAGGGVDDADVAVRG
jgi:hypothetical protein